MDLVFTGSCTRPRTAPEASSYRKPPQLEIRSDVRKMANIPAAKPAPASKSRQISQRKESSSSRNGTRRGAAPQENSSPSTRRRVREPPEERAADVDAVRGTI